FSIPLFTRRVDIELFCFVKLSISKTAGLMSYWQLKLTFSRNSQSCTRFEIQEIVRVVVIQMGLVPEAVFLNVIEPRSLITSIEKQILSRAENSVMSIYQFNWNFNRIRRARNPVFFGKHSGSMA